MIIDFIRPMALEQTIPSWTDSGIVHPSGRVLIVDDEPAILFAYKRLIHAEGYTVDACEDLADALIHIDTFSYLAVITDIRLSGSENTGGIDLLQALLIRQPEAKVIVITGYGDSEMQRTLEKLGASHYFEKPVKPSLIIELLRSFKNMVDEQLEDIEFGISLPDLSEAECL